MVNGDFDVLQSETIIPVFVSIGVSMRCTNTAEFISLISFMCDIHQFSNMCRSEIDGEVFVGYSIDTTITSLSLEEQHILYSILSHLTLLPTEDLRILFADFRGKEDGLY